MAARTTMALLAALLLGGWSSARALGFSDVQPCEPLDPHAEYSNYNDAGARIHLGTVETHHFDPDVEHLRKGETAPLPRDIAFVLRQFPNHYRALNAMATWQLGNKKPLDAENSVWTADCYFLRAIEFVPDDWKVHYIYAIYLDRVRRLSEAQKEYDLAEAYGASGADYDYNRGLFEVDAGHLDKAEALARKASAEGQMLPGLWQKLARARAAAASRSGGRSARAARTSPPSSSASP